MVQKQKSKVKDKAGNGKSPMNKITVDIFGTQYNIKGDVEADYIQALAKYVNDRMLEVSQQLSTSNSTKVAILAALNIADEFAQYKENSESGMSKVEKRTQHIITLLDKGIIGDIYDASVKAPRAFKASLYE